MRPPDPKRAAATGGGTGGDEQSDRVDRTPDQSTALVKPDWGDVLACVMADCESRRAVGDRLTAG